MEPCRRAAAVWRPSRAAATTVRVLLDEMSPGAARVVVPPRPWGLFGDVFPLRRGRRHSASDLQSRATPNDPKKEPLSDHEVLLEVLRRFARTMTHRYDITDVLYELCDYVVEVLDATGAGVSLFTEDGRLEFVTATDETVVAAEKAQERNQAGPCYSSVELDRPVRVRDIRDHDEWPDYRRDAEALGLFAVLGLPLVLDGERIGSLNIYDTEPREWTDADVTQAGVLADIAAAYVLNASELARTRRTAEQLQTALDSRVVIEQAKGRLAGDLGISVDEAFSRLRRHARANRIPLRQVADDVLQNGARSLEAPDT